MVPKHKHSICRADRLRSPSAFRRKSLKTARSTFAAHTVCLVKALDIVAATITNVRNASTIARVPVVVRTGRREINQASILQSEAFAASVSAIVKAAIESLGLGKAYPPLRDHSPESSSQSSETLEGDPRQGGQSLFRGTPAFGSASTELARELLFCGFTAGLCFTVPGS